MRTATAMVGNAQAFDSAAYAASTFIQEVELISRGYRLSNPLPPASRLDDSKGQTRRCRRLRHALRLALDELVVSHIEAYKSLHSSANPANLERYFDMYEISRSDLADTTESIDLQANEDSESLRMLKFDLHRLFLSRRIFLCSILALDADRTAPFLDWGLVTEIMEDISTRNGSAATSLDNILDEEQHFDVPLSPRSPPSPNRERMQHHIRRFANLSQGLRGVQAKMHILREESDRFLGSADEVTSFGGYLLEQYDAIGSDMKSLLTGWEEGRTALTAIVGKNEGRISSNFTTTPSSPSRCSSPNNSLGGTTAVGGSPSDELKAQTSESTPIAEIGISEEEIFEALAFPSTRSSQTQLTREERIVKMREDRLGLAIVKDRADASRFMVKELETVIKARPRRRKPSLPITPVPFRTATGPHLPVSPKMWNREGEQQLRAVAGAE